MHPEWGAWQWLFGWQRQICIHDYGGGVVAQVGEDALVRLRAAILGGELHAGARLGEVELAEQLGVSRTPVREALRRLATEGLVELLPNRGAYVTEWSAADLEDIYELRATLESHASRRAATRITDEEIAELERLCDLMEACSRDGSEEALDRLADRNADFHRLILDAAGSTRLTTLVAAVVQVPLAIRTFHRYSPGALRRSAGHHRELTEAFRARSPEWASAVMQSHILAARSVLLGNGEQP
jgi:DNA-binding GntR family transcriptional regulator